MKLKIENLSFNIDNLNILTNINLEIKKGEFIGLIGPNGCGKSTLLRHVYNMLTPTNGTIFIDNIYINDFTEKGLAKKISALTQHSNTDFDFSVIETILMGRYAHSTIFNQSKKKDIKISKNALDRVGLLHLQDRKFSTLSGGEQQRVLIARAIAGENDFFILDEPTNHLDIKYQLEIIDIIKSLNITVFSVFHDMNIAALYCDKLILLEKGKIRFTGTPERILTENNLKNFFGVDTYLTTNPYTNKLSINYIPNSVKTKKRNLKHKPQII